MVHVEVYQGPDDMYAKQAKERADAAAEQLAFENTQDPLEAFNIFVKRHFHTDSFKRVNYDVTADAEVVRKAIRGAVGSREHR
ncbi:hypothetical protein A5624_08555 [Mycobacterium sp. 1482292.6]|nr:hypothetical protein A5624_08555 [Mycobacterium sp. 1482292.6]OBK65867.1 hypothetical protein A5653_02865 [Mycobacterium colombiense]